MTPPEERDLDAQALERVAATGVCDPTRSTTSARTDRACRSSIGAALVDGSRDHGVAYVQDITARRHAEAQLRESEARFRNMAEHAPLILWVADAAGRVHLRQPALVRRSAARRPSRRSGHGFFTALHPDDAAESERLFREATARRAPLAPRMPRPAPRRRLPPHDRYRVAALRPGRRVPRLRRPADRHPGSQGRRRGAAAARGAAASGAEDGGARHPRRRRRARLQQHPRHDHRQRRTGAGGSRGGTSGTREPGGSREGERAGPRARPADPHLRAAPAGRAARDRAARRRRGVGAPAARDAAGRHRAGHRLRPRRPERAGRSLAHPPGGDEPVHQRLARDPRRRRPHHRVAGDGARVRVAGPGRAAARHATPA